MSEEAGCSLALFGSTCRLWSMADMIEKAFRIATTMVSLQVSKRSIRDNYQGNLDERLSEFDNTKFVNDCWWLYCLCSALGFSQTKMNIHLLFGEQEVSRTQMPLYIPKLTARETLSRLEQIDEAFNFDSRHVWVKGVSGEAADNLYEKSFGAAIDDAFPLASVEVREANTCLALDRYTAAVFHLMRAVEHGMRALARGLRNPQPNAIPLEYQQWQNVIDQIDSDRKKLIERWQNPGKANALAFFSAVVSDLHAFKDDVRNVLMHTRSGLYDGPRAISVHGRVQNFFARIARHVREDGTSPPFDVTSFSV